MSGPDEESIRKAHAAINFPYDSITEVLGAVCAGELSLDDLTPAGVGRYFEGNGHANGNG